MRVLTIASRKGGTGKTTAAVNLAALWGMGKSRILAIDFDSQGNLTTGFGINDAAKGKTVADYLQDRCGAWEAIRPTPFKVDVMPTDYTLASVDLPVETMTAKLRAAAAGYDLTIIDSSPALDRITLAAIAAADRVLVPLKPGKFPFEGLRQLTAAAESLRLRRIGNPRVLGIFFNETSPRWIIQRMSEEQADKEFAGLLLKTHVPSSVKIPESQLVGEPLSVYDPASPATSSFLELAEEVLQRWATPRAAV